MRDFVLCVFVSHNFFYHASMIHQLLKTVPGPQRFLSTFDSPPDVGAAIGETAHIDLEIYGFPGPSALTLSRLIDSADLTSSPRHSVKYTAMEAPFGFVNVTISDVIDTDYTNYTLTVDNGEGEALTYSFYLYEGETLLNWGQKVVF